MTITGAVRGIASSMLAVAACTHAACALYGMLHPPCKRLKPLCGLSLANTGDEDRERIHGTKIENEARER